VPSYTYARMTSRWRSAPNNQWVSVEWFIVDLFWDNLLQCLARLVSVSPRADSNGCWWCSSWLADALPRWSVTPCVVLELEMLLELLTSARSPTLWLEVACRALNSQKDRLCGLGKRQCSQTRVNRCLALQGNAFRNNDLSTGRLSVLPCW